jgi:DNA-binding NarL/FixJ family response regulator
MVTKILIADDHQIVRQGLRFLLEKESDLKVVAEAEDGRTTVRLARELNLG